VEHADFVEFHRPALEASEAKYNLILGILGSPVSPDFRRWTVGSPGACAIQNPGYPIVLGALGETQCHRLAEETGALELPGVVGCDDTATWFVDRAVALGLAFMNPIPQQIYALGDRPNYPGAPGHARPIGADDAALFADWMMSFHDEASPHDPPLARERLQKAAAAGHHLFWVVDGQPVSMAGIVRRTRHTGTIAAVYTPPPLRGRGYAGSVTAAVVERVFAEGRAAACLYTDLRNPFSNRCYAKIGFKPVCFSRHFVRLAAG
jgi:RimJ/RimL family protein N-acetyltransferase